MGFNLSGMARGFGQATEDVGQTAMRQAILDAIEEKRQQFATKERVATQQFQSGENALNREHQTNLQATDIDARKELQGNDIDARAEQQDREHSFQGGENEANRENARGMQKTSIEAAAQLQADRLKFEGGEGDKNRQVTMRGQNITAAGQAIHAKQVEIMAKSAELDREIKQIQVQNAKRVQELQTEFKGADPTRQRAISDEISILTGKDTDKYIPVPLKDDMGNITGYMAFNAKNGEFAEPSKGMAGAGGVARPKSQAEFDALPPGARFINPADGKELVKRGPAQQKAGGAPLINNDLVQEPPGSNRPGREDGLAARKRRELEAEKQRRAEYGDSGF